MNTPFAKVFDTAKGQIVAMLGCDEDDQPEIRFYAKPVGLGICQSAVAWESSDTGEAQAQKVFDELTEEHAIAATKQLFAFASQLTE
ncbi:hypothetical protein [Chromobacterium vaccinii]|uniref:hypothetical protein n=1 Tax=Chromobacterium vaccinii TaxID=1108595 RepID=UPI000E1933A8|nr:hypothetical protein [Chromobacterium vaccinii]SUX30178.1 Uncharacterised protein [Chromobacterium vaccinii]